MSQPRHAAVSVSAGFGDPDRAAIARFDRGPRKVFWMNERFWLGRYDMVPEVCVLLLGIAGATILVGWGRALCCVAVLLSVTGLVARHRQATRASSGEPGIVDVDESNGKSGALRLLGRIAIASLFVLAATGLAMRAWSPGPREPSASPAPLALDFSRIPEASRGCLSKTEANRYLATVRDRMEANWSELGISSSEGYVSLGFILDSTGAVRFARVIGGSSPEFEAAGRSVLDRSSPFDPIAEDLACLSQIELRVELGSRQGP